MGLLPSNVLGQANMRRVGALTLTQTSDDNKGLYAATIDPSNGFAYFAAKYVYKVNLLTPLPTQVGAGVKLGSQAYSAAMDPSAGCAYFAAGANIYQVLANGTNPPTAGANMILPFGSSVFLTQMLIDTSDPSNHYLYVMVESNSTSSTLYKLALNLYPSSSAIIGSANTTALQPALGYGVIDLTNHCAYYGTFLPNLAPPYIAKFWLGTGSNPPVNYGGVALDTTTNRSTGGMGLDIAHGYGYCASDGNEILFGCGRVYKWALNGTNAPTFVASVDMHTNEGYCHVAVIKPDQGFIYFASDLSYPAFFHRFRLTPGTNAPVETGTLPLLGTTNTVPPWGNNPSNAASFWGEVFARSMVYDPVRDFAYMGRDDADAQTQPFTNQIVKVALDRDEAVVALTRDNGSPHTGIPFADSFEAYNEGLSLAGTNGWLAQDPAMAEVLATNYTAGYNGAFPISGPHQNVLQVDGAVTNCFAEPGFSNVWVDLVFQAKYWTDPIPLTLSNTPFAWCVTTNGHLAVWNCTNPPAPGNGWTELLDTSIASGAFVRVTLEANYERDANGEFYYRVWVDGVPSAAPRTWYASADTNQNWLGDLVALGRFALDDVVVTVPHPAISSLIHKSDGSVQLLCQGINGLGHRVWVSTNLAAPAAWLPLSTNLAGTNGEWEVTDTSAANYKARFYRITLP